MRKPQRNSKKFRITSILSSRVTTALTPPTSRGWGGIPTLPQTNEKRHCYFISWLQKFFAVSLVFLFPSPPQRMLFVNWSYLREWVYFDWIWLSHLNLRALGLIRNINTISTSIKKKQSWTQCRMLFKSWPNNPFALLSCLLFCSRCSLEEKLYHLHPEPKSDFTPRLLSCISYASPSAGKSNPLVSEPLVAQLCSAVLRITHISQVLMQHHWGESRFFFFIFSLCFLLWKLKIHAGNNFKGCWALPLGECKGLSILGLKDSWKFESGYLWN